MHELLVNCVQRDRKVRQWDRRREGNEQRSILFQNFLCMRSGSTAMAWETAARQSSTELRSKLDLHRGISSLSCALALPLRSSGQRHLVLVTVRPSDVRHTSRNGERHKKNASGAQRAYSSSNVFTPDTVKRYASCPSLCHAADSRR